MRAEISHASTMRIAGQSGPITRELPILRSTISIDFGRPPPGKSLAYGVAAMLFAWIFIIMLRVNIL